MNDLGCPIKAELYEAGLRRVREFCDLNFIDYPVFIPGEVPHAQNEYQAIGLCVRNRIYCDVSRTSRPAYVKGRAWSWPGYKTDRTAYGVLAHETGHYIDWLILTRQLKDGRGQEITRRFMQERWIIAVNQEKPVSGYEPNYSEAFAEAMRLYITNPDLLAAARPQRYYLIRHELGLFHVEEPWRDVLQDAPVHIRQASAAFAKETL